MMLPAHFPSTPSPVVTTPELLEPNAWCALPDAERRALLAESLRDLLHDAPGVRNVLISIGPVDRPWDVTAVVETDVGTLRLPFWSHSRAQLFCDASVHPANREPHAPGHALAAAATTLRARLAVPFSLETRGLTFALETEAGVERTWTAERSRFRNRTAVTREDRVANAAADLDVRDLLAHFYTGPALRLVGSDGTAFMLPGAVDSEGERLVTLCPVCAHWAEGSHTACPVCGASADTVVAQRPARR